MDKIFTPIVSESFNCRDYNVGDIYIAKQVVRDLSKLFVISDNKEIVNYLKTFAPSSIPESIEEANAICNHVIKILGRSYFLGDEINWHKDYISGFEWPLKFYRDIEIINLSDDSDIKIPWELSRFHHFVTLGKAYLYTEDEKYVKEFIAQINSWTENNPPAKGINWNCTMEVAIRAINLIWGYFFFADSEELSDRFHIKFYNLMLAHGKHIYQNLENKGIVNSNHYIANLLGLLYISSIFPIFKCSRKWKLFSTNELLKEMKSQVYTDGTSFEGSISYHRLVTEMFFHVTHLLTSINKLHRNSERKLSYRDACQDIFGQDYTNKFEKMFEFILFYTKPDGLSPQIGDNDCGRIIYLGSVTNNINDHRHLLAIAGEFFDRDDFRCGGDGSFEDAVWFFKRPVKLNRKYNSQIHSKAFNDSGIYILRKESDYLIVRCGELGTGGKGAHTHNDNLAFELCANGITYIVDPGTYTYSRDPMLRNYFRSTKCHNTMVIDGKEQNDFSEFDLFVLHKKSVPRVLAWDTGPDEDYFKGEIGFFNDECNVKHIREITFNKRRRSWRLKDFIYGKGERVITWNIHLNVGIKVEREDNKFILRQNCTEALILSISDINQFDLKEASGWYSPLYGVKQEARIITLSLESRLPWEFECNFYNI